MPLSLFRHARRAESAKGGLTNDWKEISRVAGGACSRHEAADSLRALYPGPDSRLELSIVSTLPTLVATIELAAIMPKLGGLETAAKLAERFEKLPVLFTSGYSKESRGLETAAGYLQKPYSPSTLGRMVREILDQVKTTSPTS